MRLNTQQKAIGIIFFFCFLLREYIGLPTILAVVATILCVTFAVRPTKLWRNILAVAVLTGYWFTYGKMIDPEVGLNFLVTIIMLKVLEREGLRDSYMIFFGLILVISAGSLFEKSIGYVTFFLVSFLILIFDFYRNIQVSFRFKDFLRTFLWVIPLTAFLFFFIPRSANPIPFQQGRPGPSEIGYTSSVMISDVDGLNANPNPVFEVQVSRELSQDELYWRGNVLFSTDGWNWTSFGQEGIRKGDEAGELSPTLVHQRVRSFTKEDQFFGLDAPVTFRAGSTPLPVNHSKTRAQQRWQWVQNYEAYSDPKAQITESQVIGKRYLQAPLSKADKDWIIERFKGRDLKALLEEVSRSFGQDQFTYSLTPGRVENFGEFMRTKKIGFCSHFSSALALILRVKGHPARLVSGFMGGRFNPFSQTYLVSQNDAHVWVEVFENGIWRRLDPTAWIAPNRVQLGGDAFMESRSPGLLTRLNPFRQFKFLSDLQMWLSQWDFRFYQWLEDMDYYGQEALLAKIKVKRQWLGVILPLAIAVFILLYMLRLPKRDRKKNQTTYQLLWELFISRLKQRGIELNLASTEELLKSIKDSELPDKDRLLLMAQELIAFSFSEGKIGLPKKMRDQLKTL